MIPKPGWTTIPALRLRLKKKWERGAFLSTDEGGSSLKQFPLRMPIKGPSTAEMEEEFHALREWIAELQTDISRQHQGISLEWKQINHRQLGRNNLPSALLISSIDILASFLGTGDELRHYRSLLEIVRIRNPKLLEWANARPFELLGNADALERLLDVADWLKENPRPGIYLRQLSLPGVDTKFIESHITVLSRILDIVLPPDAIYGEHRSKRGFGTRYGFRSPPQLLRFRILDRAQYISGCSDLTVPADDFADLPLSFIDGIERVFVIENDITALAFPVAPKTLVIFGRGYDFSGLARAGWLKNKPLHYWGDIDTHGFAILNQFRFSFPNAKSFLMDRETLTAHRSHWVTEHSPATGVFSNLDDQEASLFDDLRNDKLGKNVRLEQEFVNFDFAAARVIY